jgi:DNA-binding MarR family transcriptional regulator
MSHKATNWAVQQRGISPSAKIVLWHLADRHHPDNGCYPSQDRLAYDCEISRRSLNNQMDTLEDAGLIVRLKRLDTVTKRQKSTRYILGFEDDFAQHLDAVKLEPKKNTDDARVQNVHTGAVCKKQRDPCAKSDQSRVQDLHTNLVREPLREPCGPGADPQTPDLQSGFLEEFAAAFPRIGNLEKTEMALGLAIAAGTSFEVILAGAKAYAVEQAGNQTRYIAYSENWVAQARWVQFEQPTADPADAEKITERWVKAIKTGHQALARHCSIATARDLIARMLVTENECRDAGILL